VAISRIPWHTLKCARHLVITRKDQIEKRARGDRETRDMKEKQKRGRRERRLARKEKKSKGHLVVAA
jgi:hypothetical protein